MSAARVAILGGSGQLGSALRDALRGREVVAPTRRELALEDAAALGAFLDARRPDVLVNCAAYLHVDGAERDPATAFALNAIAVDGAAAACATRGIAFATISTDYVFDGTKGAPYRESDMPNPRTVYGISKLAGEHLARAQTDRHYVVRTSGLYGGPAPSNKGYTLIDRALAQAERGEPTRMVDDMISSPSYAPHVARAIVALLDARAYGTHHVVNSGACSWYEFVRTAFAAAGLSDAPLEPISYAAFGSATKRPMVSPLESETLPRLGIALPAWDDAVAEYVAARSVGTSAARRSGG